MYKKFFITTMLICLSCYPIVAQDDSDEIDMQQDTKQGLNIPIENQSDIYSDPIEISKGYQEINIIDEENELNKLHSEIIKSLNRHDKSFFAKYYDKNYKNSDNLTLQNLESALNGLWNNYPNIVYTSNVVKIRVNDKSASIETVDKASADTVSKSIITDDVGSLESVNHSITYLKKIGSKWKIISDHTVYEESSLKYGLAKNLDIKFNLPEIINAGNAYAAKLSVKIPPGMNCVGAINKELIQYPRESKRDIFRAINERSSNLERIIKANENNFNELVSSTVGITELTEDNNARPVIVLRGIATITKRINVIPPININENQS